MNKDLIIFSRIMTHLISLTQFDTFHQSKSKDIKNYADLAENLNSMTSFSLQQNFTAHSLECFFSRIRKKYSIADRLACVEFSEIGVCDPISVNYIHEKTGIPSHYSAEFNRKRIENLQRVEKQEGRLEIWKTFENKALEIEQKMIFKRAYAEFLKENR